MTLTKKIFYLFVSALCAVAFWYVGTGSANDFVTRTFNNVPVELINENVLNEKGLVLANDEDYFVNIKFRGTNNNLNDINAVTLKAEANLANIDSTGNQSVEITVSGFEQNVIPEEILPSTIQLEVSKFADTSVLPKIITEGKPADNNAVISATASQEVTLNGSETLLNRVSTVSGTVDVNGITEDTSSLVEVHAYDENGDLLEEIKCSPDVVEAEITLGVTKTVPVKTPKVNGETDSQYKITKVSTDPDKITIAGKAETIAGINEVDVNSVNIPSSKRSSTFSTDSEVIYPKGIISVGNTTKVKVTVEIEPIEDRSYTINNLSSINLADNLEVKSITPGSVTIQIEATSTELEKNDASKLKAEIDLKGLTPGVYNLPVNINVSAGKIVSIEPEEVSVEIVKKN